MGYRICNVCKTKMEEGYLHEELSGHFCSDECLDATFPGQSVIQTNMSEEDLEDAVLYWTAWEDTNDIIPVEPYEIFEEVNELNYVKGIRYWCEKSTPGKYDAIVEVEGSILPWNQVTTTTTTRYVIGEWETPKDVQQTMHDFSKAIPKRWKSVTKSLGNLELKDSPYYGGLRW